MKKMADMKLTWKEFVKVYPNEPPSGYSSAMEISEKIKVSKATINHKLQKARITGKIDCVQVRDKRGVLIWYYKD